jgi:hypothetical protein
MLKLNLGCGNDYRQGWVNVDKGSCKCDVVHDIEVAPFPFEDNTVEHVLLQHILEHIDPNNLYTLVKELYRVCVNGATIHIESPMAGSNNYFTDPTHKMPVTDRTFDYFDKTKALYENGVIYGWNDVDIRVVSAKVVPNQPNGPDVVHDLKVVK